MQPLPVDSRPTPGLPAPAIPGGPPILRLCGFFASPTMSANAAMTCAWQ